MNITPEAWHSIKKNPYFIIIFYKIAFCQGEEVWRWYLAGVFASLKEPSTEHVGGDLTRVGAPAAGVAQDGSVQAHQIVREVDWRR